VPYLHHVLIHFPIAFGLAAAVCSVMALRSDERWWWGERLAANAAAALALTAVVSGLLSAGHVIEMGGDPAQIATHRNVGLGATGLMLAAVVARWLGPKRRLLAVIVSVLAVAATAVAAHLGGDMLHPGLAPWSAAPHHHGPWSPPAHDHAASWPAAAALRSTASGAASGEPEPAPIAPSATSKPPAHDHARHKH
jgi:uncharacterized membrane protein